MVATSRGRRSATASSIPNNIALEQLAELMGCRPID